MASKGPRETLYEKIIRKRIIEENKVEENRKTVIYNTVGQTKNLPPIEKNIVIENNLHIITQLIRKHGIIQVNGKTAAGKKTVAQERFLNILDMLYSKAMISKDVKAAVEYLNRTAGSVSQTLDLHEHKKKLILLGTGKTEAEMNSRAKEYATIKNIDSRVKKAEDGED